MKAIHAVILWMGFFSHHAIAQQLQQTTSESKPQELPDLYALVDLRHYTEIHMAGSDVTNRIPKIQVRPTIGAKMMKNKLDVKLITYFDKKAGTSQVEQLQPRGLAEYSLLETEHFSVVPYFDYRLPFHGSGATIVPAGYFSAHKKLPTVIGSVALNTGLDLGVSMSSMEEKVAYQRTGHISSDLTRADGEYDPSSGGNDVEGKKTAADWYHVIDTEVSLKPDAHLLRKFSFTVTTWHYSEYSPHYIIDKEDQSTMTYKLKRTTENRARIAYKADDKVSVYNDTHIFHQGLFEEKVTGRRYMNILWLSSKID